jgi:hypothetical protein
MFKFVFAFVLTVGFISTSQARFIVEEMNSQQECKAEEKVCPVPGPSEVVPLQPGESHGNSNYSYYPPTVQFHFGGNTFICQDVDELCYKTMLYLLRHARIETTKDRLKNKKRVRELQQQGIEIFPGLQEPVLIPKVQRI